MDAADRWNYALSRYADSLYRLALLRELYPARAARAVAAAFTQIDWHTVPLDEHLEARLVAALPPVPGRIRSAWFRLRSPRGRLACPRAFAQLPADTRLALGLRLLRGYRTDAIANTIKRPVDEVRGLLYDALSVLSGQDAGEVAAECRACHTTRLDATQAAQPHLLSCASCQSAAARFDDIERSLRDTMSQATRTLSLPRSEVEAIAEHLRSGLRKPKAETHRAWLMGGAVTVVAIVVFGLVGMPRRTEPTVTSRLVSPRTMIAHALKHYGVGPEGDGIVHERYLFAFGEDRRRFEAETWTDTARPARHRMQLREGKAVREWQSGDGRRRLQYFNMIEADTCGPGQPSHRIGARLVNQWTVDEETQSTLRASRWQSGPWAIGRRYMEQAMDAPTLRSLGQTISGGEGVVTLSAEYPTEASTVLLKLDARSGRLREVHEVRVVGGVTESYTPWKRLSVEQVDGTASQQAALFTTFPAKDRPGEIERTLPILDPACPIVGSEQALHIPYMLGRSWQPVYGLPTLSDDIKQIYFAGPRGGPQAHNAIDFPIDDLTLVYVGAGKRLTLRQTLRNTAGADSILAPVDAVQAGNWTVQIKAHSAGIFAGDAVQSNVPADQPNAFQVTQYEISFFAEGWTEEDLLQMLGTMRPLQIEDWWQEHARIYDPEPMNADVLNVLMPTVLNLNLKPGTTQHLVVEQRVRANPGIATLRDPYHATSNDTDSDVWMSLDDQGGAERLRVEYRDLDGQLRFAMWDSMDGWSIYDAQKNIVRHATQRIMNRSTPGARGHLAEQIGMILRYPQFRVVARTGQVVEIAATMPITETDLRWVLSFQGEGTDNSGQPWLLDLEPVSITYRMQLDTERQHMVKWVVEAMGSSGTTIIQQLTVREFETLDEVPPYRWEFKPPSNARVVNVDDTRGNWQGGVRVVQTVAEVVAVAPAPVWGWPEGTGARSVTEAFAVAPTPLGGWSEGNGVLFVDARVPNPAQLPEVGFQGIDEAVVTGNAVELAYMHPGAGIWILLEGPRYILTDMFKSTMPTWSRSEEHRVVIGGTERSCWFMFDDVGLQSVICDLDQTLLVLEPRGTNEPQRVLAMLEQLIRLE